MKTKKSKSIAHGMYTKQAIFASLTGHCPFADDNAYIEITQWKNMEGFDVEIVSKLQNRFQLTYGEFDLIRKLVKLLDSHEG